MQKEVWCANSELFVRKAMEVFSVTACGQGGRLYKQVRRSLRGVLHNVQTYLSNHWPMRDLRRQLGKTASDYNLTPLYLRSSVVA